MGWIDGIIEIIKSSVSGWIVAIGLAGFLIYGFVSGRLYTLTQLTQLVDQANRRADDWHAVADRSDAAYGKLQDTVVELKPIGEAVNKLINALNEVEKTEIT